EQWARRPKTAQRLALRARIVLACADGLTNRAVAGRVPASANCVCKWRERFRGRRLPGLTDEPRPGAPRKATDDQIVDVITRTLEGPPAQANAVDNSRSRRCRGAVEDDDRTDLANVRVAIASARHVQIVGRPAVCREGAR